MPDYSKSYTAEQIISKCVFPVNVRVVEVDGAMAASSAWSLSFKGLETVENLYAGNARMDELMSIPLSLDVEFSVVYEEAAPPRVKKEESPYDYLPNEFFESLLEVNEVR